MNELPMFCFESCFDKPASPAPAQALLHQTAQSLLAALPAAESEFRLTPLSGGYRNLNYLLQTKSQKLVLRLSGHAANLEKEWTLLNYLAPDHPVPAVLASQPSAALLEYCPGIPPNQLKPSQDFTSAKDISQLGSVIGLSLARLHRLHFAGSGFFDINLKIAEPLNPFTEAWLGHTRQLFLSQRVRLRAGTSLCDAILGLIKAQGHLLDQLPSVRCLVHSDFNLKNMLVLRQPSGWQIGAILDWEFAHAGSPLTDLGNFFRFENQLPKPLIEGFLQAYQLVDGPLPAQWRKMSLLLDLAALGGFLDSEESSPLSWATAMRCLKATLFHFL